MSDHENAPGDRELGRLIEVLARQAEASERAAYLIESRALPLLERIALVLERSPSIGPLPGVPPGRPNEVEEARRAIGDRDWDRADLLIRELQFDHPDAPWIASLTEDLERARGEAVEDLRGRIDSARGANDPDGAMAFRDELARILQGDPLRELDHSLVKWLMVLIQKRLRTGTVRPDVVELASRVADRFGTTTEGASLRASLPTLRRSAGLCPRCAEPYKGLADACPKCLAAALIESPPPPVDDLSTLEEEPEVEGGPVDLNNERFWE
ncbi:hypothetical protein P12x_004767 [Tundrisphaera lichenicola]|uniref:hypothetical protein n=1 Tax=Tundrisphaera lichenicola TaxID=2029860 RepID=UPI003EC0EBEB